MRFAPALAVTGSRSGQMCTQRARRSDLSFSRSTVPCLLYFSHCCGATSWHPRALSARNSATLACACGRGRSDMLDRPGPSPVWVRLKSDHPDSAKGLSDRPAPRGDRSAGAPSRRKTPPISTIERARLRCQQPRCECCVSVRRSCAAARSSAAHRLTERCGA